MNQTLSAIVQPFTPQIIWNTYQNLRHRTGKFPWREFGNLMTRANSKPSLEGRFADRYSKYYWLDAFMPVEVTRYRNYKICA